MMCGVVYNVWCIMCGVVWCMMCGVVWCMMCGVVYDIKSSVSKIVASNESEEKYNLRDVYECYLAQYNDDLVEVEISLSEKADAIEEKMNGKDGDTTDFDRNFLLLCSMVNMSNMYRRMSEKLVDDYFSKL
ncbi:MAG: hypothetical protein ACRDDM_10660 [Paraclostridium sp.]